ncbi:uncharacterized protein BDR25DRAFT_50334 [Lindgomyces ingoldianus]|uniref:Uncharacterized protein n=1 Tax=Lindgomyces ingoldianus TaxID=673940 RepID=A0ACB6QQ75_9PLEO|nr:uncharacterized protein BDR25DRAFT_50334 [Lindgomyces ingoldianus]KAF2469007.1 hypothetical protein BDR25DRAFT_50334 [Lindgomyces ingoldianus]
MLFRHQYFPLSNVQCLTCPGVRVCVLGRRSSLLELRTLSPKQPLPAFAKGLSDLLFLREKIWRARSSSSADNPQQCIRSGARVCQSSNLSFQYLGSLLLWLVSLLFVLRIQTTSIS